MGWSDTTHVVCVGKSIGPNQQKFTEIGVAWMTESGKVNISLDLTVILGPSDKLYLFPKDKKTGKATKE